MRTRYLRLLVTICLLLACVSIVGLGGATPASARDFQKGDLFVSVGGGIIRVFDSGGHQVQDLDTKTGSAEIGDMCFFSGRMYSMNFQDQSISEFDWAGNLSQSHWGSTSGALAGEPESCVMDKDGNIYVGGGADGGVLQKFDTNGNPVATFNAQPENSGIDETDLAADQCTMLYTSEGGTIKAYNVCTQQQLPDFASGVGTNCNNLRIRPNGEVLVACDSSVLRLSERGQVIQHYDPPGVDASSGGLFALNLDDDDKHFYTATYRAGLVWKIDIDSGDGVAQPYIQTVLQGDSIGGLAVFGELTVAAPVAVANTSRPAIVRAVPDPTDISTDPGVVGTNVTFAVVVAIVVLLSSQIFNNTIEENEGEIEDFLKRYVRPLGAPFRAIRDMWRSSLAGNPQFERIGAIIAVLGATGLVYGFLEPGFSLDADGILLLIGIVVSLGAITYAYNGVEARELQRRHGVPADVRVYPAALGIAVASVLVSRVVSFQPGLVYGFAASSVILAEAEPGVQTRGRAIFVGALALLGVFALAWLLMIPARDWADSDANSVSVVLETTATMTVVGAIETLAFTMVPLEFMQGKKVWQWNRAAWFAISVALVFLFWHVLLVQDKAGFKAVGQQETLVALGAVAFCVILTAATWYYFLRRRQKAVAASITHPVVAKPEEATDGGDLTEQAEAAPAQETSEPNPDAPIASEGQSAASAEPPETPGEPAVKPESSSEGPDGGSPESV